MGNTRRAYAGVMFNGVDVTEALNPYLKSATYTDIAAGSSDEIEIVLYNFELEWLKDKLPRTGDTITGLVVLKDWDHPRSLRFTPEGSYVVDRLAYTGGPLEATIGGVAVPADSSFQVRPRTQTWQNTTLKTLFWEIAQRYGMAMEYMGSDYDIEKIEQSQQTDSAFVLDTAKKYGLKLKIYSRKLVLFLASTMEGFNPVATITRADWIDDGWSYERCIEGAYTGARISYKDPDSDDEISTYVGFIAEDAPGSRVLFINETCDSEADALIKAKAEVNLSNEEIEKISGDIWPNVAVCAGVNVQIEGLGAADGKYFVDKCTYTFAADSGIRQSIEAHKCQTRL